ncbi:type VII secretion integral membrane protein EccD [Occultella gossypii]|uniref:Type VII secretion integral membrane protein EccD n=1 Tax=Occultella gossypii TaxID=2800820 RepID=A0ABS7SFE8_9MICO|nr:type VII secretion integral membrane protein EccD [Occultella gossypii]MBZ2198011.1 type VII secretion integral membrane protein EccD [Occultella gossypii]
MTELSSDERALGQLLRVSVVAGDRRLDLAAPGGVPVAELVPGLARNLNLLDAATVFGGYRLVRQQGGALEGARSLQAQGVQDGDVLTLTSGADIDEHRVYDDLVEAVADVVESDDKPWTPKDAATTAVLAAVALLVTGAILLFGAGPGSGASTVFVPVTAALAAVLLLVSALVVERVGGPPAAPVALVQVAAVYGALAGFSALGSTDPWGAGAAGAGGGALVAGLLGLIALRERREYSIVPVAVGAVIGVAGTVMWFFDTTPGTAFAVAVAVAGVAGIGVPWVALATTPLQIVSARDDSEILADPGEIDRAQVSREYARGHRYQVGLRIAVGVVMLIAAPVVVGTGLLGTLLMVVAFGGMILSVRETYSRSDIVAVMTIAIVGVVITGVSAAVLHAEWRTGLTVAVGVVAAAVVGLTLISPKPRLWLGRLADGAELGCLAALLPLAALASGLA